MMRHLSTLLAWCGLLLSSASISSAAPPQLDGTSRSPNIVLLISDDDDYEHFGFMGSKIAQTPTLDELVANGTLFTTAHCPAPLCRPSLASMLSGKLPNQHGIYGNYIDRSGIGKDSIKLDPTGSLANRLKDAGYATYASLLMAAPCVARRAKHGGGGGSRTGTMSSSICTYLHL